MRPPLNPSAIINCCVRRTNTRPPRIEHEGVGRPAITRAGGKLPGALLPFFATPGLFRRLAPCLILSLVHTEPIHKPPQ